MALTWTPRGGGVSTFDARDSTGRYFGRASNIGGSWRVYLTPSACGRQGGLSTGPFEDAKAAMAAAESYVAAHATEPPR